MQQNIGIVRRSVRGIGFLTLMATLALLAYKFEPVRELIVGAFIGTMSLMANFFFPKDHKEEGDGDG